jgi:hypothetical protein
MPSTDRRLKLKAKDIDGSDRPAAGCVCEWIWLAGHLRDGCVCQWVKQERSDNVTMSSPLLMIMFVFVNVSFNINLYGNLQL